MVNIRRALILFSVILLVLLSVNMAWSKDWKFPPLPPPHEYGDILLDKKAEEGEIKAVFFSHWSHRLKYSCRVCHYELGFSFSAGDADITEEDHDNGLYCSACHDGKQAFGPSVVNCKKCHTGKIASDPERFSKLTAPFQKSKYGNNVNWSKAINSGRHTPLYSIFEPEEKPLDFRKMLELESKWLRVPPAYFPHGTHVKLLDCANCHPDLFKIKKKTTKHFLMEYINEGKFCGVCHLRVAFPLDDCKGCHPAIKNQ